MRRALSFSLTTLLGFVSSKSEHTHLAIADQQSKRDSEHLTRNLEPETLSDKKLHALISGSSHLRFRNRRSQPKSSKR